MKEITVIANNPDTSWDCAGLAGVREGKYCPATPKWRHTLSVNYDSNSFWAIGGKWRFYDKVTFIGSNSQIAADNLGAQNYLDVNAVLRFMDNHDLTFGVNNILDKEPPMVGPAVDTRGYYDSLGRYLFAQLTLRW
jgi:outer membrane receptor protein involved in Fe transport